jgi:phage N-6-adenine-methyltransferase
MSLSTREVCADAATPSRRRSDSVVALGAEGAAAAAWNEMRESERGEAEMNALSKLSDHDLPFEPADAAIEIGKLVRQGVECWLEAGERLIFEKDRVGHGKWGKWLSDNRAKLGFGERLAERLMEKAREAASNPQLIANLELWWNKPRGTLGTGNNEWFTPQEIIERARTVLGEIDLDPASHDEAQKVVRAKKYFDKDSDGLAQKWHGRVWLNPPYAPPLIGKFIGKLLMEWNARRITACIALTHNYTDTAWFQRAVHVANVICFPQGRVRFIDIDGDLAKPTQGQAFFYFGDDVSNFRSRFETVGAVLSCR